MDDLDLNLEQRHGAYLALAKLYLLVAFSPSTNKIKKPETIRREQEECVMGAIRIMRRDPWITHTDLGLPEALFNKLKTYGLG